MTTLTKQQLAALARLGAQARIAELVAEEDAILSTYPELAGRPRPGRPSTVKPAGPLRRPYRMSPDKRKAAAERMRAYWAARREAKAQQAGEPAQTSEAPAQPARKPARARRARKGRKAAKKSGAKKR